VRFTHLMSEILAQVMFSVSLSTMFGQSPDAVGRQSAGPSFTVQRLDTGPGIKHALE